MIYLRIYVSIFFYGGTKDMSFTYNFAAVRGFQAKKEYYIAMVPLGLLSKLFQKEEEYIAPEYRAQRCINESRIPEIRDYIVNNRDTYVFSALSASIDGDFTFKGSELDPNIGLLQVDMNAIFIINDGQHRKAAIEEAIQNSPELSSETISIVFFKDRGLARSQQMFADLNKHAVKSSKSLSTLYDDRDSLANAVKETVKKVPFLNKYIDKEKDSLGKFSSKFFTLSNFLRANQRIIKKDNLDERDKKFLIEFWTSIFTYIDEWSLVDKKEIYKKSFKEEYVLTLSIVINAFGRLGQHFYLNNEDLKLLSKLNQIDWLRTNVEWENRIFNAEGKIKGKDESIIRICNLFKLKLGIPLSKEEKSKE